MRTKEMLDKMPEKNRKYLETLKENIHKAKEQSLHQYAEEHRNVAKGYIKALVDCGVIKDFKAVWCWFTLYEVRYVSQ